MAAITIKDGDFGIGGVATFVGEELALPDPERPGLKILVPLSAIVEIDSIEADTSQRFKNAAKLGAGGFFLGGPAGAARGLLAATKMQEVAFKVLLEDSRQFVAATDAQTFADLHAAQIAARLTGFAEPTPTAADELIAKYVGAREAGGDSTAAEAPRPPEPRSAEPRQAAREATRPVFGRRGR